MLHSYHARWHSLIVVPQAPGTGQRSAGISCASWFGVLPPRGVRTSSVPGQMPLLQQEADASSDSICTFSPQ